MRSKSGSYFHEACDLEGVMDIHITECKISSSEIKEYGSIRNHNSNNKKQLPSPFTESIVGARNGSMNLNHLILST